MNEAERIVFGHEMDWSQTNEAKFEDLPPDLARQLLVEGYMEPDSRCGESPKMGRIVDFMETYTEKEPEKFGELTAHGKMVVSEKIDNGPRVFLEGVKYAGETSDEFVLEFARLFHAADAFMLEKDLHARCWFYEREDDMRWDHRKRK